MMALRQEKTRKGGWTLDHGEIHVADTVKVVKLKNKNCLT